MVSNEAEFRARSALRVARPYIRLDLKSITPARVEYLETRILREIVGKMNAKWVGSWKVEMEIGISVD
jgi:hypothetical protein